MTAGTRGSPSIPAYTNGLKGQWRYREWAGDDGKFTAGPGSPVRWNNYTAYQDELTITCCQTRFVCTRPGGGGDPTTGYTPNVYRVFPGEAASGVTANDINAALNRLLQKAKSHSWNAAVDVAQGKKTVNMVVDNLRKLGRSVMALKHGDFSTAARQLGATPRSTKLKSKDVSGRWLELQYGWMPLLSSVYEASKAYEAISNGPKKARFSATATRSSTHDYTATPGTTSFVQEFVDRRTYTLEMTEELSIPRQLGLYDPLSVLWEIVPYSFVVDWFIPIGTYLENTNQLSKLKGRWLVSRRLGTKGAATWTWKGGSSTYPYCGYHGFTHRYDSMSHKPSMIRNGAYFSRVPLSGPPAVPWPRFQTLPAAMSPRRIWNAISLAHQRFSS